MRPSRCVGSKDSESENRGRLSMSEAPRFNRVLLKLSGQVFAGSEGFGIDFETVAAIAEDVKEALDEFRVKGSPVDLLIVRDARLNHPYQVRNGKDLLEVLEVSFRTQFVGLTKYRSKVITNLKTRYGLRLS